MRSLEVTRFVNFRYFELNDLDQCDLPAKMGEFLINQYFIMVVAFPKVLATHILATPKVLASPKILASFATLKNQFKIDHLVVD
jgi:hypothetical protein